MTDRTIAIVDTRIEIMTTETHVLGEDEPEFEILVANAKRIFTDELLPNLADTHRGRYIVVDGRSGDYEIDDWHIRAQRRLRKRRPQAITFSAGIGMMTAKDTWRDWIVSWVRTKNPSVPNLQESIGVYNRQTHTPKRTRTSTPRHRRRRSRRMAHQSSR